MDFDVDLDAFLVGFGVQLRVQNRSKIGQNRRQDALALGHGLRVSFWCDFRANLDPAGRKKC